MAKNERKTRTKRAILVVIALLLVAYLISSTYSRYSTEVKADGSTAVAKWAVALKAGDKTLSSTTQDITFTVNENTDVVPGKIAPAVTATAVVDLDLTGTEVSVDFTPTINTNNLNDLPSKDKITLTSSIGTQATTSGATTYIPLVDGKAFTNENGKKQLILTLNWENDDTNNVDDTSTGNTAKTIKIPVTLTVQQHIETPTNP